MPEDNTNPSTAVAIAPVGEGVAVPEVLRKLAAIVAAEGDLKLVAEQLRESETELRMLWLENAAKAGTYAQSYALLSCIRLLGELTSLLSVNMEDVKPNHIKMLELLLNSLGAMTPQPIAVQNNQYNFDPMDALSRLARRKQTTIEAAMAVDNSDGGEPITSG